MRAMRGYHRPPAATAGDRSSPKKNVFSRAGLAELLREAAAPRRCVFWALLALVLCYSLRQLCLYSWPSRPPPEGRGLPATTPPFERRIGALADSDGGREAADGEPEDEKSALDVSVKPATIKPASYVRERSWGGNGTERRSKGATAANEDEDEDFGVAEDNDRPDEQLWTAPPAPPPPTRPAGEKSGPPRENSSAR